MHDTVSDEQRLFVDTAERFIAETNPFERVRLDAAPDPEAEDELRRRAGELGWFGLLVPEDLGGGQVSSNGLVDAVHIAYERGRALQPGPFVDTLVVARALAAGGQPEQRAEVLPPLVSGATSAGWALGALDVHGAAWRIRATTNGSGAVLDGAATFVVDGAQVPWFLVTATDGAACSQFLVARDTPGVDVRERASLDLSRRIAEVHFDGVVVGDGAQVGARGEADDLVAQQLATACVLTAAESTGAMRADFDLALQYAKDRIAFGRPIGSFQAVKHLLADTSLKLELSIAATLAAADEVGRGDPYGSSAASMAKSLVGDAGIELAQSCFQVFGGVGFTWEHDQHRFLRRLTVDAARFGGPAWHRERLVQLAALAEEAPR